jgi:hypothetical protein
MRPYFILFPPRSPVETRLLFARRSADGIPDGDYRFVEFYCDEPGCDCRRVVVQVWDQENRTLAAFSFGWESPEYYARWLKSDDVQMAREMASVTRGFTGPRSRSEDAFFAEFKKAVGEPSYVAKLRKHYEQFRAAVAANAKARKPRRSMTKKTAQTHLAISSAIYQLKITLRGVRPPIWRRVQTPGNITLARLHVIIQAAMGWTNSHLHCFTAGGTTFSTPDSGSDFEESGDESERKVRLDRVCDRVKAKILYEYDFGDGWEHEILVEKIIEPERGVRYPVRLDGKRACPPEDCGGPYGYLNLLDALKDPKHESHEEIKDWIGDEWDAEAFDLEEVNADLRRTR